MIVTMITILPKNSFELNSRKTIFRGCFPGLDTQFWSKGPKSVNFTTEYQLERHCNDQIEFLKIDSQIS